MRRRTFLKAAGGGLVALIGAGAAVWSQAPIFPKRPAPDAASALGWISHRDGAYVLTLPRIEMGQNITTALKQIACAELGTDWRRVTVEMHDTNMGRVRATVGSESIMHFAEPLAQACAALRDALASGQSEGEVTVVTRPFADLRAFRAGPIVGASPEIAHGRAIVTGAPLYAADVTRPGMLYGRVLRAPASTELTSRPRRWNSRAARAVPGFVAIVEDCGPPIGKARGLGIVTSRPGALDPVARALAVEWDMDDAAPLPDMAMLIDVDAHAPGGLPHLVLDGAPQDGLWDVDMRLDIPLAAHGPIEPRAAVAEWQEDGLSVWSGTQDAFYVRDVLADAFSVTQDRVVVTSCRVGGAFGGKTLCTVEAEAAALSRATSAPVKIQWTRAQEYALGFHRPPSSHRIRARLAEGRITDWDHAQVSSHILFTGAGVPAWLQTGTDMVIGDPGVARGMAAPYKLGRARAAYDAIRLSVHAGPWRGLGAGPNGLAIESAIDEAARVAGVDPLSFRLDHVTDPRLSDVLVRVAALSDWSSGPPQVAGARTGRGVACGIYKDTSYAAVVADVAVDACGSVRVTRLWCAHDCGFVINPDQVRAQCEGNLAWSVGMILTDDLPTQQGRVVAETFADAPIPRMTDLPEITVDLIEGTGPLSGAGETAIVAGPGAIANALRAATGRRATRFPLQPTEFAL
ncbi:CO/xanthine dehydrogenase Mo-binding subunit [Rubricella aquisinus]|uniref:CO/xanthine dehydrogenase Mo-binding subunit n=1 Tax=Rubricella aquisinus TaxID=2028108 RepID=A0A840WY50_9RHOB|nr:molybdopterin cofactor-binding domain-containing protein [Rubricella aquisinus]MBB5516090.1 CO/xanthine dehydrogenase Mo-binding subunit [Rubricella aquisinus]